MQADKDSSSVMCSKRDTDRHLPITQSFNRGAIYTQRVRTDYRTSSTVPAKTLPVGGIKHDTDTNSGFTMEHSEKWLTVSLHTLCNELRGQIL